MYSLHRGQVDESGVGDDFLEKVDHPLVTGEDEDLIGAGELDEGGGGAPGALEVEVNQDFVDDNGQAFGLFAHALDETEAKREIELLVGAAAELLGGLAHTVLVDYRDLLLPHRNVQFGIAAAGQAVKEGLRAAHYIGLALLFVFLAGPHQQSSGYDQL